MYKYSEWSEVAITKTKDVWAQGNATQVFLKEFKIIIQALEILFPKPPSLNCGRPVAPGLKRSTFLMNPWGASSCCLGFSNRVFSGRLQINPFRGQRAFFLSTLPKEIPFYTIKQKIIESCEDAALQVLMCVCVWGWHAVLLSLGLG